MRALGRSADRDGACYVTGGATAVLHGWRASTIDVDVVLAPESDALLRAIRDVKDELRINVELASPLDFIPVPQVGRSAALAKAERGHAHDLEDIAAMIERDLIDSREVRTAFERIEPELYRFPAIDPPAFRRRVEHLFPEVTSPRLDR